MIINNRTFMFYIILQSAVQVYSIDTQFSNILARLEGGVPSTGHEWDCVATIQYLNQQAPTGHGSDLFKNCPLNALLRSL